MEIRKTYVKNVQIDTSAHSPHLNIPRYFKIVIYLILEHNYTSSINLIISAILNKLVIGSNSQFWNKRLLDSVGSIPCILFQMYTDVSFV